MKNVIFVIFLLIFSLQIFASENLEQDSFFPVYGFSLGSATEVELAELGSKDEKYNFYLIHGQRLWVDKQGIFSSMGVSRGMEVPLHWRVMGFSWYLTYDQIYHLFSTLGFDIEVVASPTIGEYEGYDSFNAELLASKTSENLRIKLRFKYSKGTSKDSENTLFDMRFLRLNKEY